MATTSKTARSMITRPTPTALAGRPVRQASSGERAAS